MLTDTLRAHLLVDELQLGQSLNQALTDGRRSEFSLLLAMLSADVQDQPWIADKQPELSIDIDWRARFGLPHARPLEAEAPDLDRSACLNEMLTASGSIRAVHLQDCLLPEPLVRQQFEMDPRVWDELPLLTREKYRLAQQGRVPAREPLSAPPSDMLDSIAAAMAQPELKVHYFS